MTERAQRTGVVVAVVLLLASLIAEALLRPRLTSFDSYSYLDVARNLAGGFGLRRSVGDLAGAAAGGWPAERPTYTMDPPLFPAGIAALIRLGVEPVRAALLVPLLGFAAICALTFVVARRLWDEATAWLALALVLLPALNGAVAARAWSEPLGFALALLALVPIARAPARPGASPAPAGVAAFVVAGLVAGAAFATRYLLGFCLLVGAVVAWHSGPGRARRLTAFAAAAAPWVLVLLARNHALSGAWFGSHHPPATDSTTQVLARSLARLTQGPLRTAALFGALAAGAAALALIARRDSWRGAGAHFFAGDRLAVCVWFVLYPAVALWARTRVAFDDVGLRLLGPALLFGAPLLAALVVGAARLSPRVTAAVALAVALAGAGITVARTAQQPFTPPAQRIAWSSRLTWVGEHLGANDVIAGDDAMDLPLFWRDPDGGPRRVMSFSPAPYSPPVTRADLDALARAAAARGGTAWLLLRVRGLDDAGNRESFGELIADLAGGRAGRHPGIEPVADLGRDLAFRLIVE